MVDFIGRFESLIDDFQKLCHLLGITCKLPHAGKTKHNNYKEYYDKESREIVGEFYKKDIEIFGYKF